MQIFDYIIAGAGLTGLTTAYALRKQGKKVLLLEATARTGGQIRTYAEKGYLFESGPNTGVLANAEVVDLFASLEQETGEKLLEIANPEAKQRWIWKQGRWETLPHGGKSGLRTPLIALSDKFRLLLEPWRKRGRNPNESIAETTRRRLGRSYVDYFVDPFISGIYAGDAERIVTRFALPKLYALEQNHGSFIRGAIAKKRRGKTAEEAKATREVFSARGGMEAVVRALTKALGAVVQLSCQHLQARPCAGEWEVCFVQAGEEKTVRGKRFVTTTPAYALPELLPFLSAEELAPLTALRYAPVVQVAVGMLTHSWQNFGAFGGLVPSKEKEQILGVLFPSSCYAGRASEGRALCSFFLGGVKHPEMVELSDEGIRAIVTDALHRMLDFPVGQEMELCQIFRHFRAIPQYEADSEERLLQVLALEEKYPGLTIAGNLKDGVGLANRIWQGCHIEELHGLTQASL